MTIEVAQELRNLPYLHEHKQGPPWIFSNVRIGSIRWDRVLIHLFVRSFNHFVSIRTYNFYLGDAETNKERRIVLRCNATPKDDSFEVTFASRIRINLLSTTIYRLPARNPGESMSSSRTGMGTPNPPSKERKEGRKEASFCTPHLYTYIHTRNRTLLALNEWTNRLTVQQE